MSYESIHTVITPSTTKQMINTSNKDPCSYHKSAVNTPLTNLSVYWNHKHIRRSGTSDWTKTNRIYTDNGGNKLSPPIRSTLYMYVLLWFGG